MEQHLTVDGQVVVAIFLIILGAITAGVAFSLGKVAAHAKWIEAGREGGRAIIHDNRRYFIIEQTDYVPEQTDYTPDQTDYVPEHTDYVRTNEKNDPIDDIHHQP